MKLPRILVIDDQIASRPDLRHQYCKQWGVIDEDSTALGDDALGCDHIAVASFSSGQYAEGGRVENSLGVAEAALRRGWPSNGGWYWALVLLDLHFDSEPRSADDRDFGLRVLDLCVAKWPAADARSGNTELPVVMLSTIDRARGAGGAARAGAREYVEKKSLNRERMAALMLEHGLIEDRDERGRSPEQLLSGRSLPLLKTLREARGIARMRNGNAMILGAAGTGKSSLAQYIHVHSNRAGPFVPYFPTATAEELEYAALFGCWKGAHSTATESYSGKAEQANGGTLLIDEVQHLGSRSQVELLEFGRPVAGERWLTRLGKTIPTSPAAAATQARRSLLGRLDPTTSRLGVDVLLLSASNAPLDDADWRRRAGFSDALYSRLAEEYAAGPLRVPGLAERWEDVPLLFTAAVQRETTAIGGRLKKTIDPAVMAELRAHSWSGNLAELMGVARKVAQNAKDFEEVFLHHLPDFTAAPTALSSRPTTATSPLPRNDGEEGPLTLANLPDRLRRIVIDKNDPALEGIRQRIDAALCEMLQRCAGAALARWTKPDGRIDRIAAIRLITGDPTLDKAAIPREIKRILGLPLTPTRVTDAEIQRLIEAWANPESTGNDPARARSRGGKRHAQEIEDGGNPARVEGDRA